MKLIVIPPYKGMLYTETQGQYTAREVFDDMKEKGQLEGVEVDIDDGYPFPKEIDAVDRTEEFLAYIGVGIIKKAREYSEMGKYDAIITMCDLEAGFFASRAVSRIPIASTTQAAVHIASLIGNRFTLFAFTDACALMARHAVQNCGLDHKLISVRHPGYSSTYFANLVRKYSKEERFKVPEAKVLLEDLTNQCVAAIEKDRADSILFPPSLLQICADEMRRRLDELGYSEIPIIGGVSAAVEVAKALVNMKLTQAPRAYPSDTLKAKPEFR